MNQITTHNWLLQRLYTTSAWASYMNHIRHFFVWLYRWSYSSTVQIYKIIKIYFNILTQPHHSKWPQKWPHRLISLYITFKVIYITIHWINIIWVHCGKVKFSKFQKVKADHKVKIDQRDISYILIYYRILVYILPYMIWSISRSYRRYDNIWSYIFIYGIPTFMRPRHCTQKISFNYSIKHRSLSKTALVSTLTAQGTCLTLSTICFSFLICSQTESQYRRAILSMDAWCWGGSWISSR